MEHIKNYLPTIKQTLYSESYGIETGINNLDRKSRGLKPSELIIVGGRTSIGKTSCLIDFILSASISNTVLVYTLEMSMKVIAERMLANLAKVGYGRMKSNTLCGVERQRIEIAQKELIKREIIIDDTSGITPFYIKDQLLLLTKTEKIDCIFIDYLQLLSPTEKNNNRVQEVGSIARELKDIAKHFNVPVVVAAQLNRSPDYREGTNFKPRLSDLRESGDVENSADIVLLIYRQGYYDLLNNQNAIDNGQAEIIIAKNRNGPTGIIKCNWDAQTMSFNSGPKIDLLGIESEEF